MKVYVAVVNSFTPRIKELEVEKMNKKWVWILHERMDGAMSTIRRARYSDYESYFKTFNEAYDHVVNSLKTKLMKAEIEVERHRKDLERIELLDPAKLKRTKR